MVSTRFKREEEVGPDSKVMAWNCLASAVIFGLLFLFLLYARTKTQSPQSLMLTIGAGLVSLSSMLGYYWHMYRLPKGPWLWLWVLCVASGIAYSLMF